MNILHVTSSPRGSASYSNRVAANVLDELTARNPGATVTVRDLAREPLPHIGDDFVAATRGPNGPQTDAQRALLARSDELVDELFAADLIVIAAPMINFTIPTSLKAWIDYVARAGRTFRYSEKGPEGLLKGKKVFVLVARGGAYKAGSPAAAFDFQEPYLRAVLGFLGITDITFIHLEQLAMGQDTATANRAKALSEIERLVGGAVAAAA